MDVRREHLELWLEDRADKFLRALDCAVTEIEQAAVRSASGSGPADHRSALEIVLGDLENESNEAYSGAQKIWFARDAATIVAEHLRSLHEKIEPYLIRLINRKGMNFQSVSSSEVVKGQLTELREKLERNLKLNQLEWDRALQENPNAAPEEYLEVWLERESTNVRQKFGEDEARLKAKAAKEGSLGSNRRGFETLALMKELLVPFAERAFAEQARVLASKQGWTMTDAAVSSIIFEWETMLPRISNAHLGHSRIPKTGVMKGIAEAFRMMRTEIEQIGQLAQLSHQIGQSNGKVEARASDGTGNGKLANKNQKRDLKPPPVSNAMLNSWWSNLSDEVQQESQEHLWQLAKAAFPDNRVSRDRVRAFTLGRKRGPRPFGGEATAD